MGWTVIPFSRTASLARQQSLSSQADRTVNEMERGSAVGCSVQSPPVHDVEPSFGQKEDALKSAGMTCKTRKCPALIAMKDVHYTVGHGKRSKVILQGITGFFAPGTVTALMGPSGSGKTTLLDILAGRKSSGKVAGEVAYNCGKLHGAVLQSTIGYVEQFDTLIHNFTVKEMLQYTTDLKCVLGLNKADKMSKVDALLEQLMLKKCEHTVIGDALHKGISGGQAKRLNIAIALVGDPSILLLDEPTSGLDSYIGHEVIECVQRLTRDQSLTVCASIHSPSPAIFSLFDRVMVLLEGQTVYNGSAGKCISHFKSCGWDGVPVKYESNAAEWVTHLVTNALRSGKTTELLSTYESSGMGAAVRVTMDIQQSKFQTDFEGQPSGKKKNRSFWVFLQLLRHRFLKDARDPEFIGQRVFDKLIFSLIIMTVYWGTGDSLDPQDVVNQFSLLFMWCILPAFGASGYLPTIVLERPLFYRERADGLYNTITYFAFKLFEDLFLAVLLSPVFAAMVFYPVQLQGSFVLFWLVYMTTCATGIALGYFIAAIAPNMHAANAMLPIYVVTLLFFAGLLINFDRIPRGWQWYAVIDFLRYGWGALMINQFEDWGTEAKIGMESILVNFNLDGYSKWAWLGFESIFFVAFSLFALLAMTFISHQRR